MRGEVMKSLDKYISSRLAEENINEFDIKMREYNLKLSLGYVKDYYNIYLNDIELSNNKKIKEGLVRLEGELKGFSKDIKQQIINIYKERQIFLHRIIINCLKRDNLFLLYYSKQQFVKCVTDCQLYLSKRYKNLVISKHFLYKFITDYHKKINESIKLPVMHVNAEVSDWIHRTNCEFDVNILAFVESYLFTFLDNENEWSDDHKLKDLDNDLARYNYKVNNNKFNIDLLFCEVKGYPFLNGKKEYLEILFVKFWLKNIEEDSEYWERYYLKMVNDNSK